MSLKLLISRTKRKSKPCRHAHKTARWLIQHKLSTIKAIFSQAGKSPKTVYKTL